MLKSKILSFLSLILVIINSVSIYLIPYQNFTSDLTIIYLIEIISLILSIYTSSIILRNNVEDNYKKVINILTLELLISVETLPVLVILILELYLYCNYRSKMKVTSYKEIDAYMPRKGLTVLCLYFFIEVLAAFLPFSRLIKLVVCDLLLLFMAIGLFFKSIKNSFLDFKANLKKYLHFFVISETFVFLIYFASCIIESFFLKGEILKSINQQTAESLPYAYIFFSGVLIAPIVEELVFRKGIFSLFKNRYMQIIVSALVFGFLHTLAESSWYYTLVLSIPYVTMGFCLSYIYHKTGNIFSSIFAHMFYNLISIIILLF